MDPDAFSAGLFKWDPRAAALQNRLLEAVVPPAPAPAYPVRPRELGGLEELFQAYGIRYLTAAKIAELGFTVNTLVDMRDEELDEMMNSLSHIFRWDLLVGERYGIKAAVRAERRRQDEEEARRRHLLSVDTAHALDALSQEGLSEEPVQQDKEAAGSGGGGVWEMVVAGGRKQPQRRRKSGKGRSRMSANSMEEDDDDDDETEGGDDDENYNGGGGGGGGGERQREHPFIVTEPGEVARGKKNGLDYLFHLYEQCREFLIQVQNIAKERGEKCPTKITDHRAVHMRPRQLTYDSLGFSVEIKLNGPKESSAHHSISGSDTYIDAIFNAHPRLWMWYVPTKLRQLCLAERSSAATAASSITSGGVDHMSY
ncbi:Protein LEAFY [Striga hermonthica]|uniref:Floricaula/leafy-like transcription factor n=1 Tax=Striga hermonthica TaxID=68872 RepID=A0A9N7N5R2_STRHE|nr:Protein LEAFY [Striga hermonthica]